jgi:hypothetical protein
MGSACSGNLTSLPGGPQKTSWPERSLQSPSRQQIGPRRRSAPQPPAADDLESAYRGRNPHCWKPPAQIPAGAIHAPGSHLGYLAAKRTPGQGCRTRGNGNHASAMRAIRSHRVRSFWLRYRSVRRHRFTTWYRKASRLLLLVGTAW